MINKQRLDAIAPALLGAGLLLILVGLGITYTSGRFELLNNLLLAGGALLVLAFALLRPDEVRRLLTGRTAQYGLSTALSTLFLAAIFVLLYWLTYQNDDWRLDVTETAEFTPLPEIVSLVDTAASPIEALAFYSLANFNRANAQQYLENLQAATDNFSFRLADPNAEPLLAERYGVTADGATIFILNPNAPEERFESLFALGDRDVYAALLRLINPVEKTIYFLTGHGELALTTAPDAPLSLATEQLQELGFTAAPLDLRVAGQVPADADVLALFMPRRPLETVEVAALADYTATGGALMLIRDVVADEELGRAEEDGLADYLSQTWGITLRNDLIIDPEQARFSQSLAFIAADFGISPIISADVRQFLMLFDTARSIQFAPLEGIDQVELVRTSDIAWGETALTGLTPPELDEGDTAGAASGGGGGREWGDQRSYRGRRRC